MKKIFVFLLIISLIMIGTLGCELKDDNVKNKATLAVYGSCKENRDSMGLLIPLGGRIECEPIDYHATSVVEFSAKEGYGTIITCGDTENTPKCGLLEVACFEDHCSIAVKPDGSFRPSLVEECGAAGESGDWKCIMNPPGYHGTGLANSIVPTEWTSMESGEKVELMCKRAGLLWGYTYYGGRVRENYIAYGLNLYEQDFKIRLATTSCKVGDLSKYQRDNICKEGSEKNMDGEFVCEENGVYTSGVIPFDNWVNYISKWVYAPAEMNLVEYEGEQSYCSLRRIYSLETVELNDGCYLYPGRQEANVVCCPGESGADGAYCGDDFQWHVGGKPCWSDMDCGIEPQCNPNTLVLSEMYCEEDSTSSKKGFCVEETSTKVECCPPSYGCDTGVCSIEDGYTCTMNPICDNDGVCEAGETVYNCPNDCDEPGPDEFPWFYVIIGILVVVIIALLLYFSNKKIKGTGF